MFDRSFDYKNACIISVMIKEQVRRPGPHMHMLALFDGALHKENNSEISVT